ncbi:MAG: SH3 domain-containing protein [Anaerolineaceae bacterium]
MRLVKTAWFKGVFAIICLVGLMALSLLPALEKPVFGQFPTVSIPTVTSSPRGAYIRVILTTTEYEPINVRSGPSSTYELVGVMLVGQEAPALGYYDQYVQIEYPGGPGGKGWVFSNNVEIIGGPIPMLEPPPTATPAVTKTIDPTLAAQFIITAQPSRLPTFTEPPALSLPTYQVDTGNTAPGGVPLGLVIVILAGLGVFLTLIAILRRG